MAHNDKLVKQGLVEIQAYLDSLCTETAKKFTLFGAKFVIENHISRQCPYPSAKERRPVAG